MGLTGRSREQRGFLRKIIWREQTNISNLKIGIMIETPAAVQQIGELCDEGIDFISFGTNDLTQYILAIDRGNPDVQELYDEMHPAILYQLGYVIRVCKRKNVETSICGQAGSKKPMAKYLVEQGIDSISVNADAAKEISEYVKEMEDSTTKGTDKEPRQYQKEEDQAKEDSQEETSSKNKNPAPVIENVQEEVINDDKPENTTQENDEQDQPNEVQEDGEKGIVQNIENTIEKVEGVVEELLDKTNPSKEEEFYHQTLEEQRPKEEGKRLNGKVKWFNGARGYGFIEREGEEKDIFVHFFAVKKSGLKYLEEGEQLTFEIENSEKGPAAINLQKVKNLQILPKLKLVKKN